MKKLTTSILFLMLVISDPVPSSALTVNFYQANMGTISSTNRFATKSDTTSSPRCVNLAGSYPTTSPKVTIANLNGTARACIVNGSTTDEVRLFNARITLAQATTIVMEILTPTPTFPAELTTGVAGGYSFAAALKNVKAQSSTGAAKTANGILFKVVANGNDINVSGAVSVNCGTTSAGTGIGWSNSLLAECNKSETESLTLAANTSIDHKSRYEFRTTAANDRFDFPASGHGIISKVKDVDGGLIDIYISLGTDTAVQYPFAENYRPIWESPVPGSRSSLTNTIPLKVDLFQVTGFDPDFPPIICDSILSNDIEEDDKCSMAVTSSVQWRDIKVLKAKWEFTEGNCAKSWRFMIETAELIDHKNPSLGFKRFYFDNGKTFDATLPGYRDCTTTPTFSEVNVVGNTAPNWDTSQLPGGKVNDTYKNTLSAAGNENLRQIAIMLDPNPDGIDQSVELSELVVNDKIFKPLTSVEFVEVPTNQLPLQGVEYRITKVGSASTCVTLSQPEQIVINGGRYFAQIAASSLCGAGEYIAGFHLNQNPIALATSNFFVD